MENYRLVLGNRWVGAEGPGGLLLHSVVIIDSPSVLCISKARKKGHWKIFHKEMKNVWGAKYVQSD